MILYEQWLRTAQTCKQEIALWDLAGNAKWTFGELAGIAEQKSGDASPAVACPTGLGPEFIFEVIRAWRANRVLCPLEPEQTVPSTTDQLPPDIVHLKITSATTSGPCLLAFTASQLMADVQNIVQTMGLRPDWPNLGVISLAHSYGFSNLVLPLLLRGITLILGGSALPETVRRAANLVPAVTLPAVPALWRTWHEAGAIPQNVKLAISAGAPLPLGLEQGVFERNRLKIHNFYGSSECGGIAYDTTAEPRADGALAGSPLCNVSLAVGENGCLTVRSAAVGQAYWHEPNPNLGNGRFVTSDLAELRDGVVYLRGRLSDQINVAGRKVSPEAIESTLLTHPLVQDCLVFGVPNPELNRAEEIVACIVKREDLSSDTLRQFLLARLPAWQVPRHWRFLPSLSPNGRGKLSRAQWRKHFSQKVR